MAFFYRHRPHLVVLEPDVVAAKIVAHAKERSEKFVQEVI
jgi:hypothetical protein